MDFSSFRGKKVALWFMAAWRPNCTVVGQVLREAIRRTGEDVIVVAIDMWTEGNLCALGLPRNAEARNRGRPGQVP